MRRVGRTLSKILCGVSLLGCALACVLWVRSSYHADGCVYLWQKEEPGRTVERDGRPVEERGDLLRRAGGLGSGGGQLLLFYASSINVLDIDCTPGWNLQSSQAPVQLAAVNHFGFAYYKYEPRMGAGRQSWARGAVVPFWFVVIVLVTYPAWYWFGQRMRRLRIKMGQCPQCGYDLRASPSRCPECGTMREEGMEGNKVRG